MEVDPPCGRLLGDPAPGREADSRLRLVPAERRPAPATVNLQGDEKPEIVVVSQRRIHACLQRKCRGALAVQLHT